MKNIGMVQIYTGEGKGKTTAALGLALRAAGAGMKVFFGQFIKSGRTSEAKIIRETLPMIKMNSFGNGRLIKGKASREDILRAVNGLNECARSASSGEYDMVVLDEVFHAVRCGLVSENDLIRVLMRKSRNTELVLTGRGASKKLIAIADLVTEMKEIKHYYKKGLKARKGIEC
ncbi:MAG TPA: cob(I)yrinic acid a,c-diamide adenosyltransferase [Victivallales bacterium]|nr:cob(I)yrinic acid a,c-diamide adenosyltransferase [Victivallales bacterium]